MVYETGRQTATPSTMALTRLRQFADGFPAGQALARRTSRAQRD